ncbi:NAD(P)-binding protein [Neolentinus lepideus HHB14362 ss-1]|uniref:NAD(P)-binding protein n=1 Tax=Neolentinus lepideus HHB14362 ss-1 TaxID=1314782 RepID=A0A165MU37_9AGAM|nr:NAD(P)-binding protein [Neolentinus lepideus HHB14362 ss-1]
MKYIVTAYKHVTVPSKQEQKLPGLGKNIKPGIEYTNQEVWDDKGKPSLCVEGRRFRQARGQDGHHHRGDSGIGNSAAIFFPREGAHGAKYLLLPCNLEKEADCNTVVDAHIKTFGALHVLVNKADLEVEFEDINLEQVKSTFQSNILQMFTVTKHALPHMKRGSSTINTTSMTAYKGSDSLVDYSSTKGAIVTSTRRLAVQLAPKGIRVNAIVPGPVITSIQACSRPAEQMEGLGAGMPLHGRAAQPAEMDPSYAFLASLSDANCMTGAVLHINTYRRFVRWQ